jgi:hypothetical protein
MPLMFTNPALLLGTLAGAVPVIIHFLSRRRVQRRKFSDLRFLDEVQARQARSLGLRRWLLLLLRVLAILLIALAVAGPRWGGLGAAGGGGRSVLFVLDTSASMNTQTAEGTRLDEALSACAGMIASLPERASVQVITAGSTTAPLFGDWLPAGAGAVQGLGLVQPTDGPFDTAAVLREAARQVARAPAAQVEMVWISDLQETPLPAGTEAAAEALGLAGTVNHLVRAVGKPAEGGGIRSVILPGRAVHQGESVTVGALVTSQFPDEIFVLELDGRPVAEAVLGQPTDVPVRLDFALPVPGPGLHRGAVSRQSDVFPQDDRRPFVLPVPGTLRVLLVHGPDRTVDGPGGRGGWRYLAEALAPGGERGLFAVTPVASDRLATGDLASHQVVFFVDPEPLGRRAGEGLLSWLRQGGAAVFLLGDPAQAGYLGGSLLPALGLSGDLQYQGGNAQQPQRQHPRILDRGHPVFAGLEQDALATLEDVVWRRWFRLEENGGRVLMALTDDSPLVLEKELEAGRVVVLPFDLQAAAGGLVTSPMALPFFQRLASWLAGSGSALAAVNSQVGRPASVVPRLPDGSDLLDRSEDLLVTAPGTSGSRTADLVWQGVVPTLVGDVIHRAGFTTFTAAGDTVGVVAAGLPPAESGLNLLDAEQWGRLVQGWGLALSGDVGAARDGDLAGFLAGRNLAPWFFLLALCLLLLELFVGRAASSGRTLSG